MIIFSDNIENRHPKPVQENEKKFVSGAYVDWASEAEINAAVSIAYRKNKYFWIAGTFYNCQDDGTTYLPVSGSGGGGGSVTTIWVMATAGVTTTVSALIGKSVKLLLRGGIGTGEIITTGSATGTKVLFDTTTGDLTVHSDNQFLDFEELTIQYA